MVVAGQGRDAMLQDGPRRGDPPLKDATLVPSITTAGAKNVAEEADKTQIFEVYEEQVYDPKRAGLFDADDVIFSGYVPADVVFEPPPELAAWILETSQSGDTPSNEGQAQALRPLLPFYALTATILTAVGLALTTSLRRRARARGEKLTLELNRLKSGLEACTGDPANNCGVWEGSLKDRKAKVETQLACVRKIVAGDLETYRSHPQEVRREAARLSQRLAKLKRAADELGVLVEVKRLIDTLDAGDLFCEGQAGGGISPADVRGPGARRGERGGVAQSTRLVQRLETARDATTVDDDGNAGESCCIFPDELHHCCVDLDEQEAYAIDALQDGLQRWNVAKVDTALAKLKLLEREDLVAKFRTNRLRVLAKIKHLKKELEEAQHNQQKADYVPGLLRACVKAETFSATYLPEYESAKSALEDADTSELRAQCRRKIAVHMVTADPRLVSGVTDHLLSASTLTLLPSDQRTNYLENGRSVVSSGDAGTTVHESDRSASMAEEEEHLSSDGGKGLNNDGHSRRGGTKSTLARELPFDSISRGVPTPSGATGTYGPTPPGNVLVVGAEMQSLKADYKNAAVAFEKCDTQLKESRKAECSKLRKNFLETERQEVSKDVDVAQKEKDNKIREQLLEQKRKKDEDVRSRHQRKESEDRRQKANEAKRSLWSADNDFFRLLIVISAVVTAATIATKKGVSLSSLSLLEAVWGLVVAECRESDGNSGALTCDPSSSGACDLACPHAGSGPLSGYGDVCVVGSGDAVAGGSPGYLGGIASADSFWWVVSAAGSATGAITSACSSTFGWFLGEVLGLGMTVELCDVQAVVSLVAWLFSLVVVMKVTGFVAGEVRGPVGAAIRSIVFALWVWGRFHHWLLTTSQEALLFVAPAPFLVLTYACTLRWFEKDPIDSWRVGARDWRPAVSRVIPAVVACAFALFLGLQAS